MDNANQENVLSLSEAMQFNSFMERRSQANIDCTPNVEINLQEETNPHQNTFRKCLKELEQKVGWIVKPQEVIEIQVHPTILYDGFYPTFIEIENNENLFLQSLSDSKWTTPENTPSDMHICYKDNEKARLLSPFLSEHFDVANYDTPQDPSIGCDIKRQTVNGDIYSYDTKCHQSDPKCELHPYYSETVRHKLPAGCFDSHGKTISRSQIGNVKGKPLCQREPDTPTTCERAHGTLSGNRGNRVQNLNDRVIIDDTKVQRGFWNKSNTLFRSTTSVLGGIASEIASLAILETDIGGHCLEFSISDMQILSLDRAYMGSDCRRDARGTVASWLTNVEEVWGWQHSLLKSTTMPQQQDNIDETVSWECPLMWLEVYHNTIGNDHVYQARTPSAQRNKIRFSHITNTVDEINSYEYAHPTVAGSNKIKRLNAARFMSDTMACSGDEINCHDTEYLKESLSMLLDNQNLWKIVRYIRKDQNEFCTRILDWPEETGSQKRV